MTDEKTIVIINPENKSVEFWDVKLNQLFQSFQQGDNIFTNIKYDSTFFFILNNIDEITLWEANNFQCIQKRRAQNAKSIVKIEIIDEECYILYKNDVLELWDIDSEIGRAHV